MIKLFRKVRQRLLTENKFSKYLLYAIGEIVLVVIGILIAVNINSWKKERDVAASNKVYCTKLLEELEMNISRLELLAFDYNNENNLPSWEESVENADSLLTLVTRGLQENDLDFLLHKPIWSGGSQLNLHDETYEELLGTGKLYNIGSQSLILGIKNYYKRYEREIEYNRRWTDYALEGMSQTELSQVKILLDYERNPEGFDLQNYPWFFDSRSQEYINLQLGLRKLFAGQRHHLGKCVELIAETEQLIQIVKQEIQLQNR